MLAFRGHGREYLHALLHPFSLAAAPYGQRPLARRRLGCVSAWYPARADQNRARSMTGQHGLSVAVLLLLSAAGRDRTPVQASQARCGIVLALVFD